MPSLFDLSRRRPGFNTGRTMGIQPVQTTGVPAGTGGIKPAPGYNMSGTAPLDPAQGALQTGGGDPYVGGPTMSTQPVAPLPPAISSQPGGAGWGSQTGAGMPQGHGHNYVNPYPGMNGAQRNAAMTAEIEAQMAQRLAEGQARRAEHQAMRQAKQGQPYMGDDGQMHGGGMDMAARFGNNEGYQKLQGTFQQKPGTLPYGIPTDGAQFDAFLQSGNFDPNQVRTLRQMAAQMESAYRVAPNMTPEQKAQIEAKIAAINAAIGGYPADTAMNAMFTAPNAWGSGA